MASELDLFQLALGLEEPWTVNKVEFNDSEGELHLFLEAGRGVEMSCAVCGAAGKVHDRMEERVWRHLNFFQFKAFLHARVPRVNCAHCGVKVVTVRWARPGSGFTLLFEAFALTLAKQMPVAAVARIMGEADTRLWRLLEHYVETAREAVDMSQVVHLGVDETSKGGGHDYVTVVADMDCSQVLFVTEGKDASTLTRFKADLSAHQGQPAQIKAICSDLSPAFISGVMKEFEHSLIVFDRFHVMKLVNQAVDQVRRLEVRENDLLKNSRYLWLKNPKNLTARQEEQLKVFENLNLATTKAYHMKLNLQELWEMPDRQSAAAFLDNWYHWVTNSDIAACMKKAAKTIQSHATGLLNYFETPLTNGLLEGINSLIQAAKAKARGFRSSRYLKIVIYLVVGKLDFRLPLIHTK